jgi:hypothetical protein
MTIETDGISKIAQYLYLCQRKFFARMGFSWVASLSSIEDLSCAHTTRSFYLPPFPWPMDDKTDPLNGWPILEVGKTAREDLYGKLYV